MEKLGFITKHELYSRAAQKPQPIFPSPEQMLFDHEFTKLVKELEGQWEAHRRLVTNSWLGLSFTFMLLIVVIGMITKAVHKSSEEEKKEEEVKKTLEQHDNIVTQYKELIREQVNAAKNCLFLNRAGTRRSCWSFHFDCSIFRMLRSRSWRNSCRPWRLRTNSCRPPWLSSCRRSSSTRISTTSSSWN